MSIPHRAGSWIIFPIVAIASLVAGIALALRSHRPGQDTPQAAAPSPASALVAANAPAAASDAPAAQPRRAPTRTLPPLPQRSHTKNTATTDNGISSIGASGANESPAAALASLSPRQRAILEKIPSARFRDDVLALDPEARARVFKALGAKPLPDADYASVHVTQKGMLYYVCQFFPAAHIPADTARPANASASDDPTSAAAPVPVSQPPIRHSRPGSRNVLFLDFGGMDIADTAWNEMTDLGKIPLYRAKPYNIEGDDSTFSDQEQRNIIEIWERVAEDFAPFDVDVTTEKPAAFNRTTARALITSHKDKDGETMPNGNTTGGVAFLNVFGEYNYQPDASPALIYYDKLLYSTDSIADAVSHELGHNLGLSHDGPGPTLGDDKIGYYLGHGSGATSWAPIMGAGYGRNIVQWSKGEYYGANNKEDDLAIIEGKLGYRGNLAAGNLADADTLAPLASGLLGATGLIRHAAEPHYYHINLGSAGTINFTLDPCRVSGSGAIIGNTDLKLEILYSNGNPFDSNNPDNATTASLSRHLAAGEWYVRISSTGAGTPTSFSTSGYTAYGSIGQYTLATNLVQSSPALAASLNSDLNWRTETLSAAEWSGQAATTHDGVAAAQSGQIDRGESTGIVTTVEGPGTVSFWWRISSDTNDYIAFFTSDMPNGIPTTEIMTLRGEQGWVQNTFPIANTGTHHFGWRFRKSILSNTDLITGSAWIDQVTWTPSGFVFKITPGTRETPPDAGQFAIAIETPKTWTATTDAPWLALSATSGNGNATLAVAHDANDTNLARRGTITITSAGINRTCEVAQPFCIPFETALNNTLTWRTGGDRNWTTQTLTTHDGLHAARSGLVQGVQQPSATPTLDMGQETWIETTVNGPGILSFWWKVSSEEEFTDEIGTWGDILHFTINGQEHARTSGEKNWARRAFIIAGTGTLRWNYQKDPAGSIGGDAGWLDQVTWTTGTAVTLNVSPDTKQVSASYTQFTISVDTEIDWSATSSAAWLAISPASGSGPGTINVTCSTNTATTARTGIITVQAGDLTGACAVTQAAAGNSGTNNNNNNNGSSGGGGGGGGAPSLWSLAAIGVLSGIRKMITKKSRKSSSPRT